MDEELKKELGKIKQQLKRAEKLSDNIVAFQAGFSAIILAGGLAFKAWNPWLILLLLLIGVGAVMYAFKCEKKIKRSSS